MLRGVREERMPYSTSEDARERANLQATRLAGAIARMMTAYQSGALTMQRLKTGNRQQMIVRHVYQQVNMGDGGQALVRGEVNASRRGAKGSRKPRVRSSPEVSSC